MRNHRILALALSASAFLAFGCSSTKMETTEVPKPAPAVEPQPEPAIMTPMEQYTVARRDTLWDISGKQSIYGDNFQWPLIFKTNRDQIQDPDLIHPKQELGIKKDFTMEEVNHARDLASRTPKYVPHTKPRETLPIDYF